ncbi:hypothetical protein HU200_042992 [Digitaria exilis]|uniref:Uncharacterized protein n=1 Tax=Digitaria exilis TaxID=1010633 RepID=A0A835BC02_9POAL|nr:hypothetical protein HU200_042992 [Digitaria exilis]
MQFFVFFNNSDDGDVRVGRKMPDTPGLGLSRAPVEDGRVSDPACYVHHGLMGDDRVGTSLGMPWKEGLTWDRVWSAYVIHMRTRRAETTTDRSIRKFVAALGIFCDAAVAPKLFCRQNYGGLARRFVSRFLNAITTAIWGWGAVSGKRGSSARVLVHQQLLAAAANRTGPSSFIQAVMGYDLCERRAQTEPSPPNTLPHPVFPSLSGSQRSASPTAQLCPLRRALRGWELPAAMCRAVVAFLDAVLVGCLLSFFRLRRGSGSGGSEQDAPVRRGMDRDAEVTWDRLGRNEKCDEEFTCGSMGEEELRIEV